MKPRYFELLGVVPLLLLILLVAVAEINPDLLLPPEEKKELFGSVAELYTLGNEPVVIESGESLYGIIRVDMSITEDGIVRVSPVIRFNEVTRRPLYIDQLATTFEKKAGTDWSAAPAPQGRNGAVLSMPSSVFSDDSRYIRAKPCGEDECADCVSVDVTVYVDDPSAEYRLTVSFFDNVHGYGEPGVLELKLRFSEE